MKSFRSTTAIRVQPLEQFDLQELMVKQNINCSPLKMYRVMVREFCIDHCLINSRAHLQHNRNKGKALLWVGKAKEKETEL